MKYLLTLAVVILAVRWWIARARAEQRRPPPAPAPPPPAPPPPMCACVHCGLMLPAPEAWLDEQGRAFCGAEHRRLGPRP